MNSNEKNFFNPFFYNIPCSYNVNNDQNSSLENEKNKLVLEKNKIKEKEESEINIDNEEEILLFKNTPVTAPNVIKEGKIDISGLINPVTLKNGHFYDVRRETNSYRSMRDTRNFFKELRENREKWDQLHNKNYPYKSSGGSVPIMRSTVKINTFKNLKILHWNANGVTGKVEEIKNLINEFKPDVVSLNETKTNSTTESYIYEICELGYKPRIKSRPDKKEIVREGNVNVGGGVALLVRDTIVNWPIDLEKFGEIEAVVVGVRQGNKDIHIFSWYNKPKITNINAEFLEFVENHEPYILVGDLNAHIQKYGSLNPQGTSLESHMQWFRGKILNEVDRPTNIMYRNGELFSKSTIDLVITSDDIAQKLNSIEVHDICPVLEGDEQYFHLPVEVNFNIEMKRKKERNSFHRPFQYEKVDWKEYVNEIERALIDERGPSFVDQQNERINEAIKNAAEKIIPKIKEHSKREANYPSEILEVLKSRNHWGKQFRKFRDKVSAENYENMQKIANEMIHEHRVKQWQEFVEKQGKNPLSSIPFWKRINRLRESKRHKHIESLVIDGERIFESQKIAESFARNLESKFKKDDNPRFNNKHKNEVEDFLRNKNSNGRTHFIKEFTMMELVHAIKNMNSKTSIDPSGISNKMLKYSGPILKERLLELFNQCLLVKKVPKSWRHSEITMLLKPGQDSSIVNSYRPISMTSCIARLFERMVLSRLQQFLKNNNLIIKNQSGFRKSRQTRDNLFHLIQKSQESFNKEEKSLAIFFDVAAAFDKVWHQGLLFKLYSLGIPPYLIDIIKAFLDERTFVVKINGEKSSIKIIECGVPQGGVLSPTLFSIYVNDLPLAEGVNESTLLFADDILYNIRYKYKEKNRCTLDAKEKAQKKAQEYLNRLEHWMNEWRLTLAPHKCAHIVFSKARDHDDVMDLKLYGTNIPWDSAPKFLGIVFDTNLAFDNHLTSILKKVNDRLNILKILSYDKRWRLDDWTLIKIYKSLIRSVLDYACITSTACCKKVRDQFEVIQNNALRIIYKKSLLDQERVQELRDKAGLETIAKRHEILLERYYESVLISNNPLVNQIFLEYKEFKRRNFIRESLAVDNNNVVNLRDLEIIKEHNRNCIEGREVYETTLCLSTEVVRNLILDHYQSRTVGSHLRNGIT